MKCPYCHRRLPAGMAGAVLGSKTSEAKAAASRENGKRGGRPRKDQQLNLTIQKNAFEHEKDRIIKSGK